MRGTIFAVVAAGTALSFTAGVPAILELSSERQLFVDDHLIERSSDVFRTTNYPLRAAENPVMGPDRPWEGYLVLQPGTVIYDAGEQVFKMWYNAMPSRQKPSVEQYLCYATSRDGIRWQKPDLNLVEFQGSTANNIILRWSNWTHALIRDSDDPDPQRRYKLAYWQTEDKSRCGVWVAFSPDGIRFRDHQSNPVVPCTATGDTFSVMRDPATRRYWLYHKTAIHPLRKVSRMWSDDFIRWRESRQVLEPDQFDQPDTEFYGLSAFPCGGQYLGLLWVFHTYTQQMDTQLVSSRDGVQWHRVNNRRLFLPLGYMKLEYGGRSFDSDMIYPASAPAEKDGQLWIYYSGFSNIHSAPALDHTGKIGVARLRRDGFCSLDATSEGHVLTRPLRLRGQKLTVNVEIRRLQKEGQGSNPAWSGLFSGAPDGTGWLRVEVQDLGGKSIPGYGASESLAITKSGLDVTVGWRSGNTLAALEGRSVRLKFILANARLYSFQVH